MTKEVPMDKPLSEEDRAYLHARGEHQRVEQIDAANHMEKQAEAPVEEEGDDYDNWTYAELQQELGNRQLSKAGKQEELIARLREWDAAQP